MPSSAVSLSAPAGLLLLSLVSTSAFACESDESFLFTCQTENASRSISLCGQQEDSGEGMRWLGLHYVYETENGIEFSYPTDPAQGFKQFYFSHFFRNGLYEAYLRFAAGSDSYRIFFRDSPESANPDEVAAPDAGVEISRGGKIAETIRCGERPSWYFDQTRFLTACDMENPLGAKACEHDPPELK